MRSLKRERLSIIGMVGLLCLVVDEFGVCNSEMVKVDSDDG